ncbi:hypothetical protein FRC19_001126 [Serendipita sp. 401]|nr:hypothetical protein FRC19_001126 [Serendipita sp. 401]
MERKGILDSIANIASATRKKLTTRAASIIPPSERNIPQPVLDIQPAPDYAGVLEFLKIPQHASSKLVAAYLERVAALRSSVEEEATKVWKALHDSKIPDNALHERFSVILSVHTRSLKESTENLFNSAVEIVRIQSNSKPGSGSRWDKKWVPLLVWWFTSPDGQYPDDAQRRWLSRITGLTHKQINTWFQNRRARTRKRIANGRSVPTTRRHGSLAPQTWCSICGGWYPTSSFAKHGHNQSVDDTDFSHFPVEYREEDIQDDDSDSDEYETGDSFAPEEDKDEEDKDIEYFLVDDGYAPSYSEIDEEAIRDKIRKSKGIIPNALDQLKVPPHSFPTPMAPRIWDWPSFEPTTWPRQPLSLDAPEPVQETEVQTLANQIYDIRVSPPPEEESILHLSQLCGDLNLAQQTSPSDAGSQDNAQSNTDNSQVTAPLAPPPSGPHHNPVQQASRGIRFGIGKGRLVRRTLEKQDGTTATQMLPPPTIPRRRRASPLKLAVVKNITTGRQARRRPKNLPAVRQLPHSINAILQDLKEGDELAINESDQSSSGSSRVESDEEGSDYQSTGPEISEEPWTPADLCDGVEIPECFKMTFDHHIAETALQETLSQLGISNHCIEQPTLHLDPDVYPQCFDTAPDKDLAAAADRLPTGPEDSMDVWRHSQRLTDNYYAPASTIKEFLYDSIYSIAYDVTSPLPSQQTPTNAPPTERNNEAIQHSPPPPIQKEDDYTQYLTFEHHEEPADFELQPFVLEQRGLLPALLTTPDRLLVPAIFVSQEPIVQSNHSAGLSD